MNLTNLTSLLAPLTGTQCLFGTVIITPTGLIGATTGFLVAANTAIPIRQVPGPGLQGVSIDRLNGRSAILCGNFIQDVSGITFNVTFAFPVSAS